VVREVLGDLMDFEAGRRVGGPAKCIGRHDNAPGVRRSRVGTCAG
jgi:hypothetical protein